MRRLLLISITVAIAFTAQTSAKPQSHIQEQVQGVLDKIKEKAHEAMEYAQDTASRAIEAAKSAVHNGIESAQNVAHEGIEAGQNFVQGYGDTIAQQFLNATVPAL